MPKDEMPWYCKVCKVWCCKDMKTCPKCIKKESLRFPAGDYLDLGTGGMDEIGAGGVQPAGSEVGTEGRKDVSAADGGREGGR